MVLRPLTDHTDRELDLVTSHAGSRQHLRKRWCRHVRNDPVLITASAQ